MELWNLPAIGLRFQTSLDAAAQYPSCDAGSVGSVVLVNTTLNTVTVAYYTGTTAGSTACFVCDESSEYTPNTTTTAERVCRSNGSWSGSPIICGMYLMKFLHYTYQLHCLILEVAFECIWAMYNRNEIRKHW